MARITYSLGKLVLLSQPTYHLMKPEHKADLSFLAEQHIKTMKGVRTLSPCT